MKIAIKVSWSLVTGTIILLPFCCFAQENQHAISAADRYFSQLEALKKEENWKEIVRLGEEALKTGTHAIPLTKDQAFSITDQLVSTYFRLGDFVKAKTHAECLLSLGSNLKNPELVADSLYKFSAALRGEAGSLEDPEEQRQRFQEARKFVYQALDLCKASCSMNYALKARILFNAGAAECDDPQGDRAHGIFLYQDALKLFVELREEDYRQRTLLRLGKAYLLQGEIAHSRQVLQEFQTLQPEPRTKMHFYYLQAQVLRREGFPSAALQTARDGMAIAVQLQAKADMQRFEQFLSTSSD